jgi:hypothetical protein
VLRRRCAASSLRHVGNHVSLTACLLLILHTVYADNSYKLYTLTTRTRQYRPRRQQRMRQINGEMNLTIAANVRGLSHILSKQTSSRQHRNAAFCGDRKLSQRR